MRATSLLLAFAFLGSILIIPTGAAQNRPVITLTTWFDGNGGDNLLRPESEQWNGSLTAQIDVPPFTICPDPVEVLFRVKGAPHYATVVIATPSHTIQPQPNASPTPYHVKTAVSVMTNRDAPAYEDGIYEFAAEVIPRASLPQTCSILPADASATALIKNDYRPGIKIGDPSYQHEGLEGRIDIPVTNLANGPTRVRAVLSEDVEGSFVLLNAQDLVLESTTSTGPEAMSSGILRIAYLLDHREHAEIHVRFLAGHDLLHSESEEVEAIYEAVGTLPDDQATNAPIHEESGERLAANLPGPDLPLSVLACAGLLALVRRRRR